MHKTPYVFPIIGGTKVEQLLANLEALNVSLSSEQLEYLESIVPFDPGFPHAMIGDGIQHSLFTATSGHIDRVSVPEPIKAKL